MTVTYQPTGPAELRTVSFGSADARALLAEADAYNEQLYGHADATPIQPEEFEPAHGGLFVVAYLNGQPAGCGGYRRGPDYPDSAAAEFKRLFVRPDARRQGIAHTILEQLEKHAHAAGYTTAILDVGGKQVAAHTLYERAGYRRIPGFSIYRDRPGNRAYGKEL